jgi:electron transport complex protein RnfG
MKEIFRLCLVLTLIAACSAALLAFVSQKTAAPIARAELEEKMSAVRKVLPAFDNQPDKDVITLADAKGRQIEVYRGRKDGNIVGAAFEVVAPDGYSGDISFIVGVDRDGVVQGIEILKHLETPGLGAKIVTHDFRDQFKDKSLTDPETWAVTKDGGTIVPITGATISSRAVTKALHGGLVFFKDNRAKILELGGNEAASDSVSAPADTVSGEKIESKEGGEDR